jgi:lysozyme
LKAQYITLNTVFLYSAGGLLLYALSLLFKKQNLMNPNRLNQSPEFGKVIEFFIKEEGLRLTPYPDGRGFSIGIGHQILPGEEYLNQGISKDTALELFRKDLNIVDNAIDRLVTVGLTFNQRLALGSLIYNIGQGAFAKSTVLRELNKGDFQKAGNAFLLWNKSRDAQNNLVINPVLQGRRQRERLLFLS